MPKQIQEIKDFLLTARRKDAKSQDQEEQSQHQVQGEMQPLSLHVGRSRSRKGGEAQAVSPPWTRRQGIEVKKPVPRNGSPLDEKALTTHPTSVDFHPPICCLFPA